MWKFMTENGDVDFAYVDGYDLAGRLLEGVFFKITILPDNTFRAELTETSKAYFESQGLDEKKWLAEAEKYAVGNDIFYGPDMDSGVWVVGENGGLDPQLGKRPKPVIIGKMESLADILSTKKPGEDKMYHFKTAADIGSIRIYGEDLACFFSNGYGDGEFQTSINLQKGKGETKGWNLQGHFEVKTKAHLSFYDCGEDKAFTFTSGRYFVYSKDGNMLIQKHVD